MTSSVDSITPKTNRCPADCVQTVKDGTSYSPSPVAGLRRPRILVSVEDIHSARSLLDLDIASSLTNLNVRRDSKALFSKETKHYQLKNGPNVEHENNESNGRESPEADDYNVTALPREPLSAWLLLARVFLFTVISGISWSTFSLYYVEYTQYFNASKGSVGWIISIQSTVSFLFSIFLSAPIDAYGCAPTAAFGSLVFCIGLAASALAPSVGFLVITQGLIAGIGLSCVYMSSAVVVQQHFFKNRALGNGLSLLGYSTGSFIGPFVVTFLLETYGWRGTILLHSGISLHCVPLGATFWVPKNFVKPLQVNSLRGLCANITDFRLLRRPIFCLYIAAGFFHRYTNTALIQHLPSRAVWLGVSKSHAAYLPSLLSLSNTCVRIAVSFISNIQGCDRQALMTFGLSLEGISNVILLAVSGYTGCTIAAVVFGAGMGIGNTLATVVLVDLLGVNNLSRGLSLLSVAQAFALLVSTPLTGFIYDQTGNYDNPFYVSLASSVMAVLLMMLIFVLRHTKSITRYQQCTSQEPDSVEEE